MAKTIDFPTWRDNCRFYRQGERFPCKAEHKPCNCMESQCLAFMLLPEAEGIKEEGKDENREA